MGSSKKKVLMYIDLNATWPMTPAKHDTMTKAKTKTNSQCIISASLADHQRIPGFHFLSYDDTEYSF